MAARHRVRTRPSGTALRIAWIGATATVVLALVTGLVVLVSSSDKSPAGNQSRLSQSASSDEFELVIRTVSFTTSAKGQLVTVAGVVHGLGGGQAVYAVAQPMTSVGSVVSSSSVQQWFVGGRATVRDDGGWSTHIQVKPTVSALRVVAVNAATPETRINIVSKASFLMVSHFNVTRVSAISTIIKLSVGRASPLQRILRRTVPFLLRDTRFYHLGLRLARYPVPRQNSSGSESVGLPIQPVLTST